MRLLSLRPERSASANSATSACDVGIGCGVNFISKDGFVNQLKISQDAHISFILTQHRQPMIVLINGTK